MITWGISANSHDAAIAVFKHGYKGLTTNKKLDLVFASHSERYSGIKNDPHLNEALIQHARNNYGAPDEIVWYENPYKKTMRQITAGQGLSYVKKNNIKKYLEGYNLRAPISYVDHHKSHAAAGYFTSGYSDATVICIDSIGEFETLTVWNCSGKKLKKIYSQGYPHSIGLWYSAMTQRIGLKPQEDEYILMGMAAYGDTMRLFNSVLTDFIKVHNHDNSPRIDFKRNLHRGCSDWRPELNSPQDLLDIAAATQSVYEYLLKVVSNWARSKSPSGNLVLMGGCALNCAANSKIISDWNKVWIMPNPGDAGSAIGAVLAKYNTNVKWPGANLGYSIEGDYPVEDVIKELVHNGICGVASGRAEFGPRALGNRSLLADPRGSDIKERVNNIKHRQQFRPFAPAILAEHAADYFAGPAGPYMQYTSTCKYPDLYPAICHADGTSRVQTVSREDNPNFRKLLERWYETTGCPMLLNTSLNIKGMPMVNDLTDAQNFAKHYNIKVYS